MASRSHDSSSLPYCVTDGSSPPVGCMCFVKAQRSPSFPVFLWKSISRCRWCIAVSLLRRVVAESFFFFFCRVALLCGPQRLTTFLCPSSFSPCAPHVPCVAATNQSGLGIWWWWYRLPCIKQSFAVYITVVRKKSFSLRVEGLFIIKFYARAM